MKYATVAVLKPSGNQFTMSLDPDRRLSEDLFRLLVAAIFISMSFKAKVCSFGFTGPTDITAGHDGSLTTDAAEKAILEAGAGLDIAIAVATQTVD